MSDLKQRVLDWLGEHEDHITEPEDLLEAFKDEDPEELQAIRQEEVVRLVAENIKEMPHLKFHDLKSYYPFPSSKEVKLAQAQLDPEASPEVQKKH